MVDSLTSAVVTLLQQASGPGRATPANSNGNSPNNTVQMNSQTNLYHNANNKKDAAGGRPAPEKGKESECETFEAEARQIVTAAVAKVVKARTGREASFERKPKADSGCVLS
jgi:hypothetical protein